MTQAIENPATDRQIDYLKSLIHDRDVDAAMDVAFIDDAIEAGSMTKYAASALIGEALKCPRRPLAQARVEAAVEALTHGMYRKDGIIYKVQIAIHGSGRLYAKRLVVDGEGHDAHVHFEYAAGVIRNLRIEDRMTIEEAKAFGALYGTCCVCGRTLTDEISIANGIGPVCAKRFF